MSKQWKPVTNHSRSKFGDAEFEQFGVNTKAVCSRAAPISKDCDPVAVPIFPASTYRVDSVDSFLKVVSEGGYIYQRLGNPTTEAVEVVINELECGKGTVVFTSGLAAMQAIFLCFLKAGDHIVCQKPIYSGTQKFIENVLQKFAVNVSWVRAGCSIDEYRAAVNDKTRMLLGESPCNPDMSLVSFDDFAKLGRDLKNVLTVIDSTFASPYVQQPLKHGVDITFHSCTKYLGGHSDLIGGCVTINDVSHWQILKNYMSYGGTALAAFDSYLLVRGIKTLPLRMERISATALKIAEFMERNPKVVRVWYPGLKSHPQHQIAKQQMRTFGGMVSFEMRDYDTGRKFVEAVKLITLGVSLGGTESLIAHAASMTHGPLFMSYQERHLAGVTDGLIRLSVGLEDAEDLIADLQRAVDSV